MDWSSFSVGNAAGFIKGPDAAYEDALRSAATSITIGSITPDPREGNPGTTYYIDEYGTSINALGLPNPGLERILECAPTLSECARSSGKKIRYSVAGFSSEDYIKGFRALSPFGEIELNLGCPNVWTNEGQKPIASYNPRLIRHILSEVQTRAGGEFDVKVSPYYPDLLMEVANVLREFRVRNVICSNTFPNGLSIKNGKPVLQTPGGYGGIAGNALFHIMLGNVAQMVSALEGSGIGVIASGGISTSERLIAVRDAGAVGAQIGTAFGERGAKVFSEILSGLLE
jgi:dihydroorotate dehydrogenase